MRVKKVVGNAIMVDIRDVRKDDVLAHGYIEGDPIISRVEHIDGKVRFWYKQPRYSECSKWMDPDDHRFGNGCVFIYDLNNEREEFDGSSSDLDP